MTLTSILTIVSLVAGALTTWQKLRKKAPKPQAPPKAPPPAK